MRRLLSRILLVITGCMIVISCSKQDILDTADNMVGVSLSLSVSSTAYTKDVDDSNAALDYSTDNQNKINDLYILLVDKNGKFQYLVEELLVQNSSKTLYKGSIPRPPEGSKLVLLANINQQSMEITTNVTTWLNSFKGRDLKEIYDSAIFGSGEGVWSLSNKSIPMWGEVEVGEVNTGNLSLTCNMYKALAKINVWVNGKEGIEGFVIDRIVVKNSLDKGYFVSQSSLDPDITVQYDDPYVPSDAANRGVDAVYANLAVTDAFSDEIYVVEQDNSDLDLTPITIEVHYTLDGAAGVGTIRFQDENGASFNVTRNHSYIFNISKVRGVETNVSLVYDVVDYYDIHKIDLGFN